MKYSVITRKLAKFIYQFVDRYDFGRKSNRPDAAPHYVNDSDTLNYAFETHNFMAITKLTMTHIENHLDRHETYYYTSKRSSNSHLLMIDIDAHNGETDAMQAAYWITDQFFPGAYCEPSTNGKGAHIYLVLTFDKFTKREFINQCLHYAENSFAHYLALIVKDAGFESNICGVYGLCSTKDNEGNIVSRGKLAKIPRPKTIEDVIKLSTMPQFSLIALRNVINDAKCRELGDNAAELILEPKKHESMPKGIAGMLNGSDAWEKSKAVTMLLAQQLGRMPLCDEVTEYYESMGLGTKEAKRDRVKRHQRAINSVEKTYDIEKASGGYRYMPGMYLGLLKQHISEAKIKEWGIEAKYNRKITFEDLDVCLGYHVLCCINKAGTDLFCTAPRVGLIALFRKLKELGQINRSTDNGKIIAMRSILERALFIELIDGTYNDGIAKKWGLGMMAIEYNQYETLRNSNLTPTPTNEAIL